MWRGKVIALVVEKRNGRPYYMKAGLWKDGKRMFFRVHDLVAPAFLGPRPPGQQTRHGPRGQLCNWDTNLSYGTDAQNKADKLRDGVQPRGSEIWLAKLTEDIVRECRIRNAAGESSNSLAREFGVASDTMSRAIRGRTWAHVA